VDDFRIGYALNFVSQL